MKYVPLNAVNLVDVPPICFFKTLDNNNHQLYNLRNEARRTDGFFIVRKLGNLYDESSFPLGSGDSIFLGNWFLGKIIPSEDPKAAMEFDICFYRRANYKELIQPLVNVAFASDKNHLETFLSTLNTNGLSRPDHSMVSLPCPVFADYGFDVT